MSGSDTDSDGTGGEEPALRAVQMTERSKAVYEAVYSKFDEWRTKNQIRSVDEECLLTYFSTELASNKPSTRWSRYSMLKTTIQQNLGVDIGRYADLLALLKQKPEGGYTPKKSKFFTREEIFRFLRDADDKFYLATKVVLIVGVYGACRRDELLKLTVNDIEDTEDGVKISIPNAKAKSLRQFCITSGTAPGVDLLQIFRSYARLRPAGSAYSRFFLGYRDGRCIKQPIGINTIGAMAKKIAEFLGLPAPQEYTGNCFRRSAAASVLGDTGISVLKRIGRWDSSPEKMFDVSAGSSRNSIDPLEHGDPSGSAQLQNYLFHNAVFFQDDSIESEILPMDIKTEIKTEPVEMDFEPAEIEVTAHRKRKRDFSPSQMNDDKTTTPQGLSRSITINVDIAEFYGELIDTMAVYAMPIDYFDSQSYQRTSGLVAKGLGLPISAEAMKSSISVVAERMRAIISDELKHRLISVKFELCPLLDKKMICMNAHFIDERAQVRTLSVEEMTGKPSVDSLSQHVQRVLQVYGLSENNVYSVTSDLVTKEYMRMDEDQLTAEQQLRGLNDCLHRMFLQEWSNSVCRVETGANRLKELVHISFDNSLWAWLKLIRQIVLNANSMNYGETFKAHNVPVPRISNLKTQWLSAYFMVEDLFKHRLAYQAVAEELPCFEISDDLWSTVEEFYLAFRPLYEALNAFECEILLMGDVLKIFKKCIFDVEKLSPEKNRFGPFLKTKLEHEIELVFNRCGLGALLFDQRWCFLNSPFFPENCKSVAVDHIIKTALALESLNTLPKTVPNSSITPSEPLDEFEAAIQRECNTATINKPHADLRRKLIELTNQPTRLPSTTDIVAHWESLRTAEPELYRLAVVALAAPVTRASSKTCRLAKDLLRNRDRLGVEPPLLDDLILLRCNQSLLPVAVDVCINLTQNSSTS